MSLKAHSLNFVLLFALLLIPPFAASSKSAEVPEYTLKAVFLERFARFVEWPDGTIQSDATRPFVISIIGGNPFNSTLDHLYADRKIKGRLVQIRYISDPGEIQDSNILFIATSSKEVVDVIISVTQTKPVLTVSDQKGFADRKVHINLYSQDKKFPFEINLQAVQRSGLSIDYLLLNIAKIINPKEEVQ
jgi:YfiR/HmsC-like